MKSNLIKGLMLTLSLGLVAGLTACNNKPVENSNSTNSSTSSETIEHVHTWGEVTYDAETLTYVKTCTADATHVEKVSDAGVSAEYPFQVTSAETLTKVLEAVTAEKTFVRLEADVTAEEITLNKAIKLNGNNKKLNAAVKIGANVELHNIAATSVRVLPGAKVLLTSDEKTNTPKNVIDSLVLGYDKETKTTSTLVYTSGKITNFELELASGENQKVNLGSGYTYTSGSEWANHN